MKYRAAKAGRVHAWSCDFPRCTKKCLHRTGETSFAVTCQVLLKGMRRSCKLAHETNEAKVERVHVPAICCLADGKSDSEIHAPMHRRFDGNANLPTT